VPPRSIQKRQPECSRDPGSGVFAGRPNPSPAFAPADIAGKR
jgi:hypothetical protein